MNTSMADEIRARLSRYLSGEFSIRQFDEWFVPATWPVDQTTDTETQSLVGEIYLRIAEYTNGDWTEDELKNHLKSAAGVTFVQVA